MGKYRLYPTFSLKDRIFGTRNYQWGKFVRLIDPRYHSALDKKSYAERNDEAVRYAARKKLHNKVTLETAIAGGRSWSSLDDNWKDGGGWWIDWQLNAAIWLLRRGENWQRVWVREKLQELMPKAFAVSRRTMPPASIYIHPSTIDHVRYLVGDNEDAIAAMMADELLYLYLTLYRAEQKPESYRSRDALSLCFWRAVAHHNLHQSNKRDAEIRNQALTAIREFVEAARANLDNADTDLRKGLWTLLEFAQSVYGVEL